MKYIKYNTGDQLWFNELNEPLYCIDNRGLRYDFRVDENSLLELIPCPWCYCRNKGIHDLLISHSEPVHLDVEILDESSNDTYFYNFISD